MQFTLTCLLVLATMTLLRADLPLPKTGGPGGQAMALLVLSDSGGIDAKYEAELTQAGYRIEKAAFSQRLSLDYLKQFGAVILTRLPYAGEQYQVGGEKLAPYAANMALLQEYMTAGGGVLFETAMSEFGESYADTYNRFMAPYDLRFIPQQLRHDAETKDAYAAGMIASNHPIAVGLKEILYPIHVLRWDHAYSTVSFEAGKAWTVLAMGKPGAGTHQALDNSRVGAQLTPNRTLFALRPVGNGWLAVSAVHSYYTLTHAYAKDPAQGENDTGVIDGIPLNGEVGGRPSEFGKLLDRTYRFLAANSAKRGLGGNVVPLPEQPPKPAVTRVIDWHTAELPPTWQHRVTGVWLGNVAYYDEHPDPLAAGDLKYFKALVGPRTAASSGSGTVKAYRDAAIAAGYSAIFFAETFPHLTKEKWEQFVRECDANTDDAFACVPGMQIEDFQGGIYLVLGARRFPDPTWLTDDGKRLEAVRMLSLGWYGHLASVHRSCGAALHPQMYKHFQGVTVATYDGKGKLVDDSFGTYQWQVFSDSNPIPIAAHELTAPDQVALAGTTGYQQILPAVSLSQAVDYFRFAMPHFFDDPLRYFISEGPILDGWSMRNKDLGNPAENRDHFRLGISVTGTDPIAEATLYDGTDVAGRWYPNTPAFKAQVDGNHEMQHEYLLLAKDSKGRRVLSPGIRTTTRNWRLRCGDRQNWLGTQIIYTGWNLPGYGSFSAPMKNLREGSTPAPILDFPYYSNHVQIQDVDLTNKYIDPTAQVGGDARPTFAIRANDLLDGALRTTYFMPKRGDFAVTRVDVTIRLKRAMEPETRSSVFPSIAGVMGKNELILLPGKAPVKVKEVKGALELPVGSYVGGIIPLTPGLRYDGKTIGFPAPPGDTLQLYKGTTYTASYLVLKGSAFRWRSMGAGYEVDAVAEKAVAQMGFNGTPPYAFALKQGTLDKLAYAADCTAQDGGIAGTLTNAAGQELLFNIPLQIRGLNPRCAAAVWRSDSPKLEYFSCFQDTGLVPFNGDKTVDFYAGNVVATDPVLFVNAVVWTADEALFRVNNPTRRDITTNFATAPAIKGFKAINKQITVKAGTSVEVKE